MRATTSAEYEKVANMAINITTNPANWQAGEAIVWGAVDAANYYANKALDRRLAQLKEVIRSIDEITGIKHEDEEDDRLSFNAEIVLERLQGTKIRMDTDRHLAGISELAQKGVISYNKKSKKWMIA